MKKKYVEKKRKVKKVKKVKKVRKKKAVILMGHGPHKTWPGFALALELLSVSHTRCPVSEPASRSVDQSVSRHAVSAIPSSCSRAVNPCVQTLRANPVTLPRYVRVCCSPVCLGFVHVWHCVLVAVAVAVVAGTDLRVLSLDVSPRRSPSTRLSGEVSLDDGCVGACCGVAAIWACVELQRGAGVPAAGCPGACAG